MQPDFRPLELAIDAAMGMGATAADAYLESQVGLTVKVFDMRVERFSSEETRGMGVRVYSGDRQGRAYSSDLDPGSIRSAVASALESARVSPEDPDRRLPDPSLFPPGARDGRYLGEELGILGGDLLEVPAGEKIEFAREMERFARERDPRVTGVETSTYTEATGEVVLANTEGFRSGYRASVCYGYLIAIAEQGGESQTGFGFTAGRSFRSLDSNAAAAEAATMAVDLLGARQVPTVKVPVIFDNLSTAELFAALGAAVSGESVAKGRSYLAGRLGDRVASQAVTVTDDGLMIGGFGTAPFDGEGVATSGRDVVAGGTLETFLHNTYTASRMSARSTGNASRQSFRAQVGVSPSNITLVPGPDSPGELRSAMKTGFEVRELQGVHVGLNPVTGEISLGAKGRWVEGGRPSYAVREVTIAGMLDDLFRGIIGVGNDLRYTPLLGGIGTPSILVEGMAVSGK